MCFLLLCANGLQPQIKADELRLKSKEELQMTLEELKKELASLRVAKVSGGGSKLTRM
jgi:ribosomal protein L29